MSPFSSSKQLNLCLERWAPSEMQLSHPPKAVHTHTPGTDSAKATKHSSHRNSTLCSILKLSLSFGAAPHPAQQQNSRHSAVREAGFYLKAALLQMVTIKPSQCFPPLLSPNTLWDPGLGAPPRQVWICFMVTKATPANAKCYGKSNFSVDHTSCCLNI